MAAIKVAEIGLKNPDQFSTKVNSLVRKAD